MDMSKTLSDLPMDLHRLILSHDEEKIELKKENEKLKTRVKMLQCLLDEARQDSDSDEDTDEDESDESEDESEENNKCDNECGCVLSSDVHIYCWKKGDEKLTVCSECYLRYRYWWDDENPENENVIREHKDI
eukprot:scaffold11363_cov94-Phaeocystis_antarctica.AAC.4